MSPLEAVCNSLSRIAPLRLAESWDNVGLLVGDRSRSVSKIMTCLTITPNVVDEAIDQSADLVVTHHPLPFKSLSRITTDSIAGEMILRLIAGHVAVYSAHTAFDSAVDGINQMWADLLDLQSVEPLEETPEEDAVDGAGRLGRLSKPLPMIELVRRAAAAVGASVPRLVGDPNAQVSKVALACGSGGSFLAAAQRRGCDAMITGEATFHTALEAEALGIGLGLLGHYWSERFAMERLAVTLGEEFPDLTVWASTSERDPIVAVDPKD